MKLEYERSPRGRRVKLELDRTVDKAVAIVVVAMISCAGAWFGFPADVVDELRALVP
jgi:hypothetical protein